MKIIFLVIFHLTDCWGLYQYLNFSFTICCGHDDCIALLISPETTCLSQDAE